MGADKIFFALNGKDGQADRKISIVQYFEEFHGSKVTRPRLPCVQVSYHLLYESQADMAVRKKGICPS